MISDPKTTITGVVVGVSFVVRAFGLPVPDQVVDAVTATAMFFLGYFTKDK